jgi:pimeloyl-ACP methyl ester carboxylesterase
MPVIQTDKGIKLHYIISGSGPHVVMVHGFLGNLAVWHLQIVPLLRRDFCITTYDLRGHGYSEATPSGYTAHDMAEDMRGLLDHLGIERPKLVGHSFGADVCLCFAHLYPDRVERVAALEPGLAALVHQRKDASWVGWSYWASKLAEVGVEVPPEKQTDLEYLMMQSLNTPKFYGPARGLPRNRAPLVRLIRETTLLADYEVVGSMTLDAVRRIQTPVLLIYGAKSHFLLSYEVLKDALPNQRNVLLPGGEHFGPLEQPEALALQLRQFLSTPVEDLFGTALSALPSNPETGMESA